MNAKELIQELQNQKEMLGNGFFDQELLEKYLDASFLKQYNENEEQIKLFGLETVDSLQNKLTKIYPYATTKPKFNRIKGDWNTMNNITHASKQKITITLNNITSKQKQKTFKQDKAA